MLTSGAQMRSEVPFNGIRDGQDESRAIVFEKLALAALILGSNFVSEETRFLVTLAPIVNLHRVAHMNSCCE